MRQIVEVIQEISARQIATALRRKLRKKVRIFTDDGNKITGTVLRVSSGLVTLRKAKIVHVNEKRRVKHAKHKVRVATSKIDSFQG